jgi:hypothetical protein
MRSSGASITNIAESDFRRHKLVARQAPNLKVVGSHQERTAVSPAETTIASILASGLWAPQTRSWRRPASHLRSIPSYDPGCWLYSRGNRDRDPSPVCYSC